MESQRYRGESEGDVMCRASDVMKQIVGISKYVPGSYPHARIRKPTWHGARGNGHATSGPALPPHPVIALLAQQHRLIRQMVEDAKRARCRRGE
jgi:hypothetical protein